MHLVNADGGIMPVVLAALFHPLTVVPRIVVEFPDARSRFRRHFRVERERVRLVVDDVVELRNDVVLIGQSRFDPFDKTVPDARSVTAQLQRVRRGVVVVEIAPDADRARIGRPDGELDARRPFAFHKVRPQLLIELRMGALFEEVDIQFAEPGKIVMNFHSCSCH